MRITKVYTKFGDGGKTYLANGEVVSKGDPRVESYGDVDELNSFLGLARSEINLKEIDGVLKRLQNDLFKLGADLATPENDKFQVKRVSEEDVRYLESLIDKFNSELEPLKEFILPYGNKGATLLHVCRTVCRRAERSVVRAVESGEKINPYIQIYLNRLSDLLFVLARWCNFKSGFKEEFAEFK